MPMHEPRSTVDRRPLTNNSITNNKSKEQRGNANAGELCRQWTINLAFFALWSKIFALIVAHPEFSFNFKDH